jgi:hypothetical protein
MKINNSFYKFVIDFENYGSSLKIENSNNSINSINPTIENLKVLKKQKYLSCDNLDNEYILKIKTLKREQVELFNKIPEKYNLIDKTDKKFVLNWVLPVKVIIDNKTSFYLYLIVKKIMILNNNTDVIIIANTLLEYVLQNKSNSKGYTNNDLKNLFGNIILDAQASYKELLGKNGNFESIKIGNISENLLGRTDIYNPIGNYANQIRELIKFGIYDTLHYPILDTFPIENNLYSPYMYIANYKNLFGYEKAEEIQSISFDSKSKNFFNKIEATLFDENTIIEIKNTGYITCVQDGEDGTNKTNRASVNVLGTPEITIAYVSNIQKINKLKNLKLRTINKIGTENLLTINTLYYYKDPDKKKNYYIFPCQIFYNFVKTNDNFTLETKYEVLHFEME